MSTAEMSEEVDALGLRIELLDCGSSGADSNSDREEEEEEKKKDGEETVQEVTPVPKDGVTLKVFQEFIELNGGRERFENMKTFEVSDSILKKVTFERQSS